MPLRSAPAVGEHSPAALISAALLHNKLPPEEGFAIFDLDRDNKLSVQDVFQSCESIQLDIPEAAIRQFILDATGEGEFLDLQGWKQVLSAPDGLDAVLRARGITIPDTTAEAKLKREAEARQTAMNTIAAILIFNKLSAEDGYDTFDVDDDGQVSLSDLRSSVTALNLGISEEDSKSVFESLDTGKTGFIPKAAWGEAIAGASAEDTLRARGITIPDTTAEAKLKREAEEAKRKEEDKRKHEEQKCKREEALRKLAEMGFTDKSRNEVLLEQSHNDVAAVVDRLSQDALASSVLPPSVSTEIEDKFSGERLILGTSDKSDLKEALGLEDTREFAKLMPSMAKEWQQHGSTQDLDNWEYVVNGTARDERDIPLHVKQSFISGSYHGGKLVHEDYDAGHDGMDLDDFVNHPIAKLAGLKKHEVVAARLYTSDSYPRFNQPMRNGTSPHPFRVTMYVLDEMLRKMQKVEAKLDPEAYANTKILWRGMKDGRMDIEGFKRIGGVELAPMSTTSDRDVADSFACGRKGGLLFKYTTKGKSRGVLIDFLSLYPKEKEYLYAPLTFLTFDIHAEGGIYTENGVMIVPVEPQV